MSDDKPGLWSRNQFFAVVAGVVGAWGLVMALAFLVLSWWP